MRSLRKIPMSLSGTNFCINCTSSPYFAPSFMQLWNDPNAPKHYETHQNMSLGSNRVDQVCLLRKITTRLRGTNFCLNWTSSVCTSSPRLAPSFMHLRNDPKCTQTLWNTPKHEVRVQWGWIGSVRCEKSRRDFVAQTFALIAPVHPVCTEFHAGT